jgi:hypothetical protein
LRNIQIIVIVQKYNIEVIHKETFLSVAFTPLPNFLLLGESGHGKRVSNILVAP